MFVRLNSELSGRIEEISIEWVSVANSNEIKIVSPYIGLAYLQRVLSQSARWLLISDIESWLASLAKRERTLSIHFIEKNREQIRHLPGIHAKTVICPETAYLGSANLTTAGINQFKFHLRHTWIPMWLEDLEHAGFLVTKIATSKGVLGSYRLNEGFKWTARWKLFETSRQTWNDKLKQL